MVRQRTANPSFIGSNPIAASNKNKGLAKQANPLFCLSWPYPWPLLAGPSPRQIHLLAYHLLRQRNCQRISLSTPASGAGGAEVPVLSFRPFKTKALGNSRGPFALAHRSNSRRRFISKPSLSRISLLATDSTGQPPASPRLPPSGSSHSGHLLKRPMEKSKGLFVVAPVFLPSAKIFPLLL